MKRRVNNYFICYVFFLLSLNSTIAQWSDDFSSGNLIDWSGDVDKFVVNSANQLQLQAPDIEETFIYRNSTIGADSVSIGFYHLLDFSPSDNNKSTIYIGLDAIDLSVANGYYLEIGENGSDDAIKVYYLNNGSAELVATATMGAMADDPALVRIQIDILPGGLWSIRTNYSGEVSLGLELEFVEDRFSIKESQFFGLACNFSASRADKFFYDDMFVKAFEADKTPPNVSDVIVESVSSILLSFNEPVALMDAENPMRYSVDNGVGSPSKISVMGSTDQQFLLDFPTSFDPTINYRLTVNGIRDREENLMTDDFIYDFSFPIQPQLGDLLLSEILFDPFTGGEDFIEIYNISDKYLDLQFLKIRNVQKDETKQIEEALVLKPKSYLALSEDVVFLNQEYKPAPEANISTADLPSFNNDQGNVTILTVDDIVLDAFDYEEDFHFQLLDDTEGISLERVTFDSETNNSRNWQSGSESSRFATPGYQNSSTINVNQGDEMFVLSTESFSPNQDGSDDLMVLSYNLEKNGFVANISIHDAAGFKIKEISNNELLSTKGIITWDGTNEDGSIADLGIYIIVGSIFHIDGEVINLKKSTVLADFID